jgi:hypothetical protein
VNAFHFDKAEIQIRCQEFFDLYDITKPHVREMCRLKKIHTWAVAENCASIASHYGLEPYDCDLAWVIGELHDFARFGQAVVTNSLDDSERFNHAHLGSRILFTHHLIDDIIPDFEQLPSIDKIVMEKAVYHHSDFHLPDDLTERELLFCKIIREADQLDIFRTIVDSGWKAIYGCTREELLATPISDAMEEAFYQHKLADYSKRQTPADFHMAHIALCFGLETSSARMRAWEQGYIRKMIAIEFTDPEVQRRYAGMKREVEAHLRG